MKASSPASTSGRQPSQVCGETSNGSESRPRRVVSVHLDVQAAFRSAWQAGQRVYPSTVRGLSRPTPLLGVVALAEDADAAGRLVDRVVETIADPTAVRT
ncbi:MAG: hypothetical protein ACM30G_17145 [Micromonosporaceae bacterium]